VPPVTIHPAAVLLGAAVGRLHSPAAEISGPPSWTDSRSRSPRAESHPNHARRSSSVDVEGASARSRSRARRPCSRPREDLLPAQARAARRRAVDARRLLGEHGRVRAQRRIRCSSGAGGGCGGREAHERLVIAMGHGSRTLAPRPSAPTRRAPFRRAAVRRSAGRSLLPCSHLCCGVSISSHFDGRADLGRAPDVGPACSSARRSRASPNSKPRDRPRVLPVTYAVAGGSGWTAIDRKPRASPRAGRARYLVASAASADRPAAPRRRELAPPPSQSPAPGEQAPVVLVAVRAQRRFGRRRRYDATPPTRPPARSCTWARSGSCAGASEEY
jgi:hypothetical protein